MEHVRIFDTTLRDGEQSPGASMDSATKLDIAQSLADLHVDIIEAGFPVASPDDFSAVQTISENVKGPTIAALARAKAADIDSAGLAIRHAEHGRIHTFIGTSPIHRERKLYMTQDQVIRAAVAAVQQARRYTDDVEFSPEDAGRTELEYLARIVEAAIKAGATTINIPDTVGYCTPDEFAKIFKHLRNTVPNIDKAVLSAHCHDDLGMAVANSLAAVQAGARQVECTINGIGERAGNTSLEEIVMALHVRTDIYGVSTDIRTELLNAVSKKVAKATWDMPRNKAIVGANAFAHEAGIHQDGMLKDRETYEIMTPESVGWEGDGLVLGKHSGMNAVISRLAKHGMPVRERDRQALSQAFKSFADSKALNSKYVSDEELIDQVYCPTIERLTGGSYIPANGIEYSLGPNAKSVFLRCRDQQIFSASADNRSEGYANALHRAFAQIIPGIDIPEGGYHIENIGKGSDAKALARITLQNAASITRTAVHEDTDKAIQNAMVHAFNGIYALEKYKEMIANEQ